MHITQPWEKITYSSIHNDVLKIWCENKIENYDIATGKRLKSMPYPPDWHQVKVHDSTNELHIVEIIDFNDQLFLVLIDNNCDIIQIFDYPDNCPHDLTCWFDVVTDNIIYIRSLWEGGRSEIRILFKSEKTYISKSTPLKIDLMLWLSLPLNLAVMINDKSKPEPSTLKNITLPEMALKPAPDTVHFSDIHNNYVFSLTTNNINKIFRNTGHFLESTIVLPSRGNADKSINIPVKETTISLLKQNYKKRLFIDTEFLCSDSITFITMTNSTLIVISANDQKRQTMSCYDLGKSFVPQWIKTDSYIKFNTLKSYPFGLFFISKNTIYNASGTSLKINDKVS